ncbi:hypothetical protein [Sphingomonas sp.]|uniref:hypothetical protein n=1 Tax=Sphingomonas sp. TaxID=28214 RepID=UPI0031D466DB
MGQRGRRRWCRRCGWTTFPRDEQTATFYIGTNDPAELTELHRRLLADCRTLPVSGEYIRRDAFDVAMTHGKDVFVAIERLGTDLLPAFFALIELDRPARTTPAVPTAIPVRSAVAGDEPVAAGLPAAPDAGLARPL